MNQKTKILVCYNEPTRYYENYIGKNCHSTEEDIDLSESNFSENLELIVSSLQKHFTNIETLPVTMDVTKTIKQLNEIAPDIVFNFVESIEGNSHFESYFTGLYDILDISYTGNNALTLGNCLIKTRTKQILDGFGIKTPNYVLCKYNKKIITANIHLEYPLIAKLVHEDASIGISEYSVINNERELKKRLSFLFNNYKQDVLVEEYIEGRELNVSILGNKALPISEITFNNLPADYPKIITYEAKWSPDSIYYKNTIPSCPAFLDIKTENKVKDIAILAFNALGCRDYARVDIRLDKHNIPYVIEVNPNPDISFDSGYVRSAMAADISYDNLLLKLANYAIERIYDDTVVEEKR